MANAYWKNISNAFQTLSGGLILTLRHLIAARKTHRVNAIMQDDYFDNQEGIATIQYPHETLPVPDNARYRLHNEIDDCIVCDKCAKICPVDCIEIEAIRAPEVFGKTSDGTAKRIHAARFDIDMGKCCFCGLCTTVCPTECLTMTKTYDFSEFDVADHVYEYATMTPLEILEKKQAWEAYQASKGEKKATGSKDPDASADKPGTPSSGSKPKIPPSPGSKPKIPPSSGSKPKVPPSSGSKPKIPPSSGSKPKIPPSSGSKPKIPPSSGSEPKVSPSSGSKPKKPVIRPKLPKKPGKDD